MNPPAGNCLSYETTYVGSARPCCDFETLYTLCLYIWSTAFFTRFVYVWRSAFFTHFVYLWRTAFQREIELQMWSRQAGACLTLCTVIQGMLSGSLTVFLFLFVFFLFKQVFQHSSSVPNQCDFYLNCALSFEMCFYTIKLWKITWKYFNCKLLTLFQIWMKFLFDPSLPNKRGIII